MTLLYLSKDHLVCNFVDIQIDADMIPSEILRDLDDPVHSSHHKKKKKKHKHKTETLTVEKKNKSKRPPNDTGSNTNDTLVEGTPVKKALRPVPQKVCIKLFRDLF